MVDITPWDPDRTGGHRVAGHMAICASVVADGAVRFGAFDDAGTVGSVTRYTPPSDHDPEPPYRRRPLSIRIGVWVLLVGVLALVFVDVLAALL